MKKPIVFRSEPSLWDMLARGEKTWDARRWELGDDRIYRLAWGRRGADNFHSQVNSRLSGVWVPDEPTVSFQNKATDELLTFRYLGMEFTPWSPGWCFLLLGERVKEKGK